MRWVLIAAVVAALATAGQAGARGGGSPPCTKQAARTAIRHTSLGRRFTHFLNGDAWTVGKLYCRPLMAGKQVDMAALAECCTAASPTPLFIFRPVSGSWRLTYSSNLTTVVDSLKLQGRTLLETRPVYRVSDPLCCPSGHTHWAISWNGRRWVVRRR